MDEKHKSSVERIRSSIQHFYDSKSKFRVYHGSTNSTRHANFDRDAIVDVSDLNRVLHIDLKRKTALVEPNVPMDKLVQETKRVGLLPPVVMEFPGITVGGGFVGTAGESSSFKHGFFDRTVLSAEVVLADGRLVTASESSNEELFNGLRGSFGTLGVLTLVELQLIDLHKYVEVTYHPVTSITNAMTKLDEETRRQENEYVDGILFSRTSGVIVSGRLVSTSSYPLRRFSRPWDPWFYLHAESHASARSPVTELVPIEDYLFRCDRGAFWMGKYAFQFFLVPYNWLFRFLLDYFMHTRIMYHAMHASRHTDRYIIQDLAIPAENAIAFTNFIDERFGIYPLWLCPLRSDTRESMAHPLPCRSKRNRSFGPYNGPYINVGVWGPGPTSEPAYVEANRDLEARCRELGGLKWLYARIFYTEEEFWSIYDKEKYTNLREKWNATSLPSIWEKMRERPKENRAEKRTGLKGFLKSVVMSNGLLSGFYGIWKAIRGGDYLLARKTR